MFQIEPTEYGFKVTSTGSFTQDDVGRLKTDLLDMLARYNRPFSLVIDARKMILPRPDVYKTFTELHVAVWKLKCQRVAFVLESPVTKRQAMQMHYEAAPHSEERFINALLYPDWESRAVAWAAHAVEPEHDHRVEHR
jgi:hypothetical protein